MGLLIKYSQHDEHICKQQPVWQSFKNVQVDSDVFVDKIYDNTAEHGYHKEKIRAEKENGRACYSQR